MVLQVTESQAKLTNSATLIVGESGSGKSSLLATAAIWAWENYGKISRLYTTDPGGFGDKLLSLINIGIVQVWRMRTRDPDGNKGLPFETIHRATQGYWPALHQLDPASGDSDRACDLLPLDPTHNVGCVLFDSLTSISEWSTVDLAARAGRGDLSGEKASISSITSGGMKFGGLGRSGVGFAQSRVSGWIQNSVAIPNLVAAPIFTALELRIIDEGGVAVYGPKVVGRALTEEIPSMVGNCLGTAVVEGTLGKEWRLYLSQYTLAGDSTVHLCKNRAAPGVMPDYLVDMKGADPFSGFSLGVFFDLLYNALAHENAVAKGRFPDAPGLALRAKGPAPVLVPATPPPSPAALPEGATPPPAKARVPTAPPRK